MYVLELSGFILPKWLSWSGIVIFTSMLIFGVGSYLLDFRQSLWNRSDLLNKERWSIASKKFVKLACYLFSVCLVVIPLWIIVEVKQLSQFERDYLTLSRIPHRYDVNTFMGSAAAESRRMRLGKVPEEMIDHYLVSTKQRLFQAGLLEDTQPGYLPHPITGKLSPETGANIPTWKGRIIADCLLMIDPVIPPAPKYPKTSPELENCRVALTPAEEQAINAKGAELWPAFYKK